MDTPDDATELLWGARVNTGDAAVLVEACPEWATPPQQERWIEPGVILWDHATQQMTHLAPTNALDVLAELRAQDDWKQHGMTVEEYFSRIHSSKLDARRRLINPMHLTPHQARTLMQLLVQHEAALQALAEPILRRQRDSLQRTQTYFFGAVALQLAEKLDLSTHPLPWKHDPEQHIWTCDLGPNRVTVCQHDEGPFWRGCLERPHQLKRDSPLCFTFEEALVWGEHTLTVEAENPRPNDTPPAPRARLSLDTLTAAHRKRLKRYWIAPQALEPAHPTYRVVIHLNHTPSKTEYRELSLGKKLLWSAQYPTPSDLMHRLGLFEQTLAIDPLGSLYRIIGLTTFADPATARERATRLWERSTIGAAFQAGTITKASYGIEEVETMYHTWIGGYGAWHTHAVDRQAFLARRAFELTLIHALDVAGYRAAMPIFGPEDTDLEVLSQMHERRMQSPAIPSTARAESAQWLREYRAAEASTAAAPKDSVNTKRRPTKTIT